MILSVLRIDLSPGRSTELLKTFRTHQIFETAIRVDGCRDLYLATPEDGTDDADAAYVVGVWDDEASYQRWLEHPERGAAADHLASLVASDADITGPARLWRVLHSSRAT